MSNYTKTKHKKSGFRNDRVHVICRRHVQENGKYPLDGVVYDFEWLARYILARRLQTYVKDQTREDIVQHMMTVAIGAARKYPFENTHGSPQPAFAYFNVVMYHAGINYLKKYRRFNQLNEQMPEEDFVPEKGYVEGLPPLYVSEKMEQLVRNARRPWFNNTEDDNRLRKYLEKTARTGKVIQFKGRSRVSRLYQAIVMLTVDIDTFPEATDESEELFYRTLPLLLGHKRARQVCFLKLMLDGKINYKSG